MFGEMYYFSTIRKYIILFGTLFNDIYIQRSDSSGSVVNEVIKVPLTYGPRDKMLARVQADPTISRPFSVELPLMTFEMKSMRYDGSRKLPTVNRSFAANTTSPNSVVYQYNPVAYNFNFELTILVKNAEDGTKIVEQILPFFTPDWSSKVKLIPELNIEMDIPVILNDVTLNDNYEGDFSKRRSLVWTLDFTLKGYLYGPVKNRGVIKFANTNFYVANTQNITDAIGNTNITVNIHTQPGLQANGAPTSNASLSVPVNEILATDDFGYVIGITEFE